MVFLRLQQHGINPRRNETRTHLQLVHIHRERHGPVILPPHHPSPEEHQHVRDRAHADGSAHTTGADGDHAVDSALLFARKSSSE